MRRSILLLVTAALTGVTLAVSATFSAFWSTTQNAGNSFAAGTVYITDNDAGGAMLALANGDAGSSDTGCILVTYSGSLNSSVRLYGTVSGGLAPYLTLTVTRGTDASPSFDSCASFVADATNYIGAGAGVVYSGLLSAFPTSYATGVVDPPSGPAETWSTSEAHSYKFVITLGSDPAGQGQTASATFTWEARNL
jgi:hypothetical protein